MSSELTIKLPNGRKPDFLNDAEYDIITLLFAQGLNRDQVIKKLGFDKNWYYTRQIKDPKLKLAEQKGYDACIDNLPKDVAVGVKKSLLGHSKVTTRRVYEFVDVVDANGVVTREKVLRAEIEDEKYFPPNASVVNAVGKQVIGSMKESDNTLSEVERKISELSDEDIEAMYQISKKVLSNE
jgi:hypothetical protein